MRVLILGGTSEASALGRMLTSAPELAPTFCLAGVTQAPVLPEVKVRIGGFGGVDGLRAYLRHNAIRAVVDATHPFAARMSHNAAMACEMQNVPLLRIERPEWKPEPGDQWVTVSDIKTAAHAIGRKPRNVFLTTGRKDLEPFREVTHHHYILRSIDRPDPTLLPQHVTLVLARPPFEVEDEIALIQHHAIDIVVTKNAGADATRAKLFAARALGLPVIMIQRPLLPPSLHAETAREALDWLQAVRHASTLRDV